MSSFFIACIVISKVIVLGSRIGKAKYSGIYFLLLIGIILTIFNNTILEESKIKKYIKGKRFNIYGVI